MTTTPANIDVQLTATAQSILMADVGGSPQITFLKVTAANTDAASHTVEVWRVANGSSPGNSSIVVPTQTIATNGLLVLPLSGQSLVNGQALWAKADAGAKVNLSIGYVTSS